MKFSYAIYIKGGLTDRRQMEEEEAEMIKLINADCQNKRPV